MFREPHTSTVSYCHSWLTTTQVCHILLFLCTLQIQYNADTPARSPTLTAPLQIMPAGSKNSFSSTISSPSTTLPWDVATVQGHKGSGDVVHLDTLMLSNTQLLSSSIDAREEKALGSDQV